MLRVFYVWRTIPVGAVDLKDLYEFGLFKKDFDLCLQFLIDNFFHGLLLHLYDIAFWGIRGNVK